MLGTRLSGGQQQRLTLARALSHQPEILCLDEFSIAIDPVTTMKIEDILRELKKRNDDRAGDQPRAAGPPAGRPHGLHQRFAADRSGRDREDLHAARPTGSPSGTSTEISDEPGAELDATPTAAALGLRTRGLNLWYGDFQALNDVTLDIKPRHHHGADRPFGLRQDHAAALLQPHQRALRQRDHHAAKSPSWARTSTTPTSRSASCASTWAWSSSGPTRCRSRSTRTCCSACGRTRTAASSAAASWTRWSNRPCATCSFGTT